MDKYIQFHEITGKQKATVAALHNENTGSGTWEQARQSSGFQLGSEVAQQGLHKSLY